MSVTTKLMAEASGIQHRHTKLLICLVLSQFVLQLISSLYLYNFVTKLDTKLEIHIRTVDDESSNESKNSNIGVSTRRKRSIDEDNSGPYNTRVIITIIFKIFSSTSMIQRYTKKIFFNPDLARYWILALNYFIFTETKCKKSWSFMYFTRREFYGNFYLTWCVNLVFYGHSGDFCHICLCFYYAGGNIRHTEYGNNSHTIDFDTFL